MWERNDGMKRLASVFILLAGALWGVMGIFVRRLGAYGFSSVQIASLRIICGAVIFLIIAAARDRQSLKIKFRDLGWFLGMGIGSLLLFTVCYFTAISMASLSVAAILLYTAPGMVMLMSVIFFKEKLNGRKLAALLLAFLGCVLVTGTGEQGIVPAAAVGFGLVSALGYGLYSIFGTVALRKYRPLTVTTYAFVCGGAGALCICHPAEIFHVVQNAESPAVLVLLIFATAFLTAVLPYLFYTVGLSFVRASTASIMASVEPVVATIAGVAVFREKLTPAAFGGILMVLCAIILLNLPAGRMREER